MSWESSPVYYRIINQATQIRLGGWPPWTGRLLASIESPSPISIQG